MLLKRPGYINESSASSPLKRSKSDTASSASGANSIPSVNRDPINVYIVEAKLDTQKLRELVSLVESRGRDKNTASEFCLALCLNVQKADVVVTAVRMRRRFERHADWKLAKEKAIVTPQWLLDSVKHNKLMPYRDYLAFNELHNETIESCPDTEDIESKPSISPASLRPKSPVGIGDRSKLSHNARFACSRLSPLVCPNQGLVDQLDVFRRSRDLEGEDISALSYARAVAVVKAYPHPITLPDLVKDIPQLPYIGRKTLSLIEEYVTKGYITGSQAILASTRFRSLSTFTSVYGIGPKTARSLYSLGLRTIQDLERYYEVEKGVESDEKVKKATQNAIDLLGQSGDDLTNTSIRVALALQHDFDEKIPRSEVEEMHRTVMAELEYIQKGCASTIAGGYRRGKPESNDVDIVITHPDPKTGAEKVKGLCKNLVMRLYERGMITHVMHLSGFHKPNSLRTSQRDALETVLTVFILPPDGNRRRVHRRLDLIVATPKVYWTAVTGWTGSTMFERDLRIRAKERGFKFDSSGITRRRDSKLFFPKSEKEVFELLGLDWIDPIWRNAGA